MHVRRLKAHARWGGRGGRCHTDNQYLEVLERRQTKKTKMWRTMLRQNYNHLLRSTSPQLRVDQRAQFFRQMQGQAEHKSNGPATALLQILRDMAPVRLPPPTPPPRPAFALDLSIRALKPAFAQHVHGRGAEAQAVRAGG
jgi:hypothetical protein